MTRSYRNGVFFFQILYSSLIILSSTASSNGSVQISRYKQINSWPKRVTASGEKKHVCPFVISTNRFLFGPSCCRWNLLNAETFVTLNHSKSVLSPPRFGPYDQFPPIGDVPSQLLCQQPLCNVTSDSTSVNFVFVFSKICFLRI